MDSNSEKANVFISSYLQSEEEEIIFAACRSSSTTPTHNITAARVWLGAEADEQKEIIYAHFEIRSGISLQLRTVWLEVDLS
jgi:hypothetical protein